MSLLNRLMAPLSRIGKDGHAEMRPLWHRIVEIAREKPWYAQYGVADTLPGRFDAITLVLCLVLLRLENEADTAQKSVWLTEMFVTDMDGQMRENGVGDLSVGKHIGKLMSSLGGRLGAFREALAGDADILLTAAVRRNVTLNEGVDPALMAGEVRKLADMLGDIPVADVLAGVISR
jgi:cytochrome b pre-mRNA-processing protein 3